MSCSRRPPGLPLPRPVTRPRRCGGKLAETLTQAGDGTAGFFGVEEFCRQVAVGLGARPQTTQWDAGAVLSALADAVSGGEVNQLIGQMPRLRRPLRPGGLNG